MYSNQFSILTQLYVPLNTSKNLPHFNIHVWDWKSKSCLWKIYKRSRIITGNYHGITDFKVFHELLCWWFFNLSLRRTLTNGVDVGRFVGCPRLQFQRWCVGGRLFNLALSSPLSDRLTSGHSSPSFTTNLGGGPLLKIALRENPVSLWFLSCFGFPWLVAKVLMVAKLLVALTLVSLFDCSPLPSLLETVDELDRDALSSSDDTTLLGIDPWL